MEPRASLLEEARQLIGDYVFKGIYRGEVRRRARELCGGYSECSRLVVEHAEAARLKYGYFTNIGLPETAESYLEWHSRLIVRVIECYGPEGNPRLCEDED